MILSFSLFVPFSIKNMKLYIKTIHYNISKRVNSYMLTPGPTSHWGGQVHPIALSEVSLSSPDCQRYRVSFITKVIASSWRSSFQSFSSLSLNKLGHICFYLSVSASGTGTFTYLIWIILSFSFLDLCIVNFLQNESFSLILFSSYCLGYIIIT